MANKKGGDSSKASNPPVKKPTTAPKATSAKAPVKVYSSPPKPITPKPIQSPAKVASVMNSPKPSPSAPTSTAGNRVASTMTSTAGKAVGKAVGKAAGKTVLKTLAKTVAKRLPYVGAAYGAYELGKAGYDAYQASKEGKKSTTPSTGTGIKKYAASSSSSVKLPLTEQTVKANKTGKPVTSSSVTPSKSDSLKENNQSTSASAPAKTQEKKTGGGGGSRAATTTSRANTPAPSKPGLRAKVPVSSSRVSSTLNVPKRENIDVTYKPEARKYSDTEKKVLALTDKGGVGGKNLTEGERMKLKSLQAKRASEKMEAEKQKSRSNNKAIRKSVRAGKFNARQVKKSAK
jgi:hypothetical protein